MADVRITTFDTMGTVLSLCTVGDAPVARLQALFARWESRFSLYRPDSEASRIAAGTVPLVHASAHFREVYAESLEWRTVTGGVFTPHRPDGVIDLSGTVKARAMQEAAEALRAHGLDDWLLNVGGDIVASGTHLQSPWSAGIIDAIDRRRLLTSIDLEPAAGQPLIALATSGTSERGEHIWRTGEDLDGPALVQVTVLATDILTADVAATAILAGGRVTLDDLAARLGLQVLAVDAAGGMLATPGLATRIRPRAAVG